MERNTIKKTHLILLVIAIVVLISGCFAKPEVTPATVESTDPSSLTESAKPQSPTESVSEPVQTPEAVVSAPFPMVFPAGFDLTFPEPAENKDTATSFRYQQELIYTDVLTDLPIYPLYNDEEVMSFASLTYNELKDEYAIVKVFLYDRTDKTLQLLYSAPLGSDPLGPDGLMRYKDNLVLSYFVKAENDL